MISSRPLSFIFWATSWERATERPVKSAIDMSTLTTDRIYDESQLLRPADLPEGGNTVDLVAGGKTYKLTAAFAVGVGTDLDLVVKYSAADISNANQTYQENVNFIRALTAKFPELREGFTAIIARAVEASGRDYGTMLAVKDIK